MANKLPPSLEKQINDDQIDKLKEILEIEFVKGSPEERRYGQKLRLIKKLNQKEYENYFKNKRKNTRFED